MRALNLVLFVLGIVTEGQLPTLIDATLYNTISTLLAGVIK